MPRRHLGTQSFRCRRWRALRGDDTAPLTFFEVFRLRTRETPRKPKPPWGVPCHPLRSFDLRSGNPPTLPPAKFDANRGPHLCLLALRLRELAVVELAPRHPRVPPSGWPVSGPPIPLPVSESASWSDPGLTRSRLPPACAFSVLVTSVVMAAFRRETSGGSAPGLRRLRFP